MPINRITNKPQRFSQQIGTIHKGAERPESGKAPGRNTDFFRFALLPGNEGLQPVLIELFGENPKQFEGVHLLGDTPDQCFPNWLEKWGNASLVRRCDGDNQTKYMTENAGEYGYTPIPCLGSDKCGCKPVGRLKVVLPQLQQATGIIGYFSLVTHSWNDIDWLHQFFSGVYSMGKQKPLSQYTYTLYRELRLISTPGKDGAKGKRNESLLALRAYDFGEVIPNQLVPETDLITGVYNELIANRPLNPESLYLYISDLVNKSDKPELPLTAEQVKGTVQLFALCEIDTGLALSLLEYLFEVYPAPNTTGVPFVLLNQKQGDALHKWLKNKDEWQNIKTELATFQDEIQAMNEIPF